MEDRAPILTATDFSLHGDQAVRRAARLAAEQRVPLELVTVLSRPRLELLRRLFGVTDPDAEARLLSQARDRLAALQEELVRELGCEIRSRVLQGSAHQEILRRARETGASLIVVGAHGERGLTGGLLGGTAGKLLRRAELPLLLVRKAPSGPYRMVLVATDFSPSCRGALRSASRLAPQAWHMVLFALDLPYETKLVTARVPPDAIELYRQSYAAEARLSMQGYLAAEAPEPRGAMSAEIVAGDPEQVIAAQAKAHRAELIILGRSGQSFLEAVLLRSVSAAVLEESGVDVLVLHATDSSAPSDTAKDSGTSMHAGA